MARMVVMVVVVDLAPLVMVSVLVDVMALTPPIVQHLNVRRRPDAWTVR
jgi:hypothetical protein